jgi:DNA-binding NarL/FixJ family response regulator
MTTELRIVIADDHPLLRAGLRQVIDRDGSMCVVADVGDGPAALERIEALRPDIVVLDIRMPGLDGFGVLREMHKRRLTAPVIFLTLHDDEELFNRAIDLGARGYILKDSALTAIVDGLRAVANGQYYVTPSLSTFLIRQRTREKNLSSRLPGLAGLTPTERRVLRLVATGQSSREIADILFVHYRTIENHRVNISQKLGLRGHNAVLKFALEHKDDI